ncbi:hypothetical protein [Devosia sp.]|nr:hypothetical protein [Devosia sp.]
MTNFDGGGPFRCVPNGGIGILLMHLPTLAGTEGLPAPLKARGNCP